MSLNIQLLAMWLKADRENQHCTENVRQQKFILQQMTGRRGWRASEGFIKAVTEAEALCYVSADLG